MQKQVVKFKIVRLFLGPKPSCRPRPLHLRYSAFVSFVIRPHKVFECFFRNHSLSLPPAHLRSLSVISHRLWLLSSSYVWSIGENKAVYVSFHTTRTEIRKEPTTVKHPFHFSVALDSLDSVTVSMYFPGSTSS